MIVAFEGMDGSGKSTIAKEVASMVNFKYEKQRLISILNISDETYNKLVKIIRDSNNNHMSFIFYTLKCMLDRDIKDNTIVERSMISTYYFEHQKITDEEFKHVFTFDVIPDITFILYASSDIRKQRIYNRDSNDPDLKSTEALYDGYKIMLDFAKSNNIPYIGINTELYTFDEIKEICSNIIKDYIKLDEKEKLEYINNQNDIYGIDKIYSVKKKVLTI